MPSDKIFIIKVVGNTADETVAAKELISPSVRIILLILAFHMYRAKRLFEQEEFKVITYKVDYKAAGNSILKVMIFLSSEINLIITEITMRENIRRLFNLFKN
jgi:hypothetical protein